MKFLKEIIIAVIIILIVVSLEIITNKKVEDSFDWLYSKIENIESDVYSDDAEEKITSIKEEWVNYSDCLSVFVEHDELEKINDSIIQIESNLKTNDNNESLEDIAELKFLISHLKEKNKMQIKNLL